MASFFILWSLLYLGYLDLGHCNFSELEKHHYYSHILNRAIAILNFPQICHEIHMKTTRAQLQAYANMYISLHLHFLVNDMRVPLVSIFFLLPSTADPSTADELTPLIDSVRVEAQKGPPGRGIPDPPVVAGCGSRRGCSRDWRGGGRGGAAGAGGDGTAGADDGGGATGGGQDGAAGADGGDGMGSQAPAGKSLAWVVEAGSTTNATETPACASRASSASRPRARPFINGSLAPTSLTSHQWLLAREGERRKKMLTDRAACH
jgi:hypothetical protein